MGEIRSGNGIPLFPSGPYKTYSGAVATGVPVTINVRTDLTPTGSTQGRDGNNGYIVNDGPGTLLVEVYKGVNQAAADQILLYAYEALDIKGEGVTKLILDTDSATNYRVTVE